MLDMKYRKLKIASSIACGILCLLLVALWVRSYEFKDSIWLSGTSHGLQINSLTGHFAVYIVARASPTSQFVPSKTTHDQISGRWVELFDKNVLGFYFGRNGRELRIDVPHWFCVLVIAMVGVVAWRVEWRFSLRTLLIGMAVIAAVLGLIFALLR
jgi:hypothetical protein